MQVGKNDSIWIGDISYRHNISYMVSPNIMDWTETPLQKINIEPGVYKISSNDIKLTTKIGKDDIRALKEYYDDSNQYVIIFMKLKINKRMRNNQMLI